jgi:hypothetical protein
MEGVTEKFTIEITEGGLAITSGEGLSLEFAPGEALMLLDILTEEEERLRNMAQEALPASIEIQA